MENQEFKILLVDDEPDILEFLSYNLKKEGYKVYTAANGIAAVETASKKLPHLILLDVMMPGMDGIETCEELRKNQKLSDVVIAFLTARGEDYSQIAGFEAGADDFITKPIKPKVLVSRIKALLRRFSAPGTTAGQSDEVLINIGELTIDKMRYLVMKKNKEIILPKKEFELLLLLTSRPEKVFLRDEIYAAIWGEDIIVGDRTIDVHIRKLREKIGEKHIKTIKGVGYKFVE
jgi:two-component system, OmpR family, alkaline phosphatase synthesis response regulator PhoP